MKKILTTLAFAAISLAGFAQATQQYMRVTFNVPVTDYDYPGDPNKKGTSVAAGMADSYIYLNPLQPYIDLNVSEHPLTFRSTTTNFNEKSAFYLHQVRNTQTYVNDNKADFPYDLDRIESITQYSIPVEKVELIEAKPKAIIPYNHKLIPGGREEMKYSVWEYTFNRLPRNVAELKTLMEDANGNRIQRCYDDPAFIVAAMYLTVPRMLDCAQDARDMADYLFGRGHSARSGVYGVSNPDMQNVCKGGRYNANGKGKDANCTYWDQNHAYQWFKGGKPSNQYKPNGKGYGYDNGPYTVFVLQDIALSTGLPMKDDRFFLISDPYVENSCDLVFDNPEAAVVYLKKTANDGWFFDINWANYFAKGKDQINPDL